RVPLGGSVQPRLRPRGRARVPRRDLAAGGREARALLLDVRPALLLDEDNAGRARLRRPEAVGRRGRATRRLEGEGRRVRRLGLRDLSGRAARWRAPRPLERSVDHSADCLEAGFGPPSLASMLPATAVTAPPLNGRL